MTVDLAIPVSWVVTYPFLKQNLRCCPVLSQFFFGSLRLNRVVLHCQQVIAKQREAFSDPSYCLSPFFLNFIGEVVFSTTSCLST